MLRSLQKFARVHVMELHGELSGMFFFKNYEKEKLSVSVFTNDVMIFGRIFASNRHFVFNYLLEIAKKLM